MDAVNPIPDRDTVVRRWASSLLDRAYRHGPIPAAGTPAWSALDDTDPRKPAAVVSAALAWLYDSRTEVIAASLAAELDQLDQLVADRIKAAATDVATGFRAHTVGPAHRELDRRRAQLWCMTCQRSREPTEPTCPHCAGRAPLADPGPTVRDEHTRHDAA